MSLYDQTEDPSYDEQEEQAFEDELDQRLALVEYYRQLYNGVFNDGSPQGEVVDKEIAKWARDQVKICAGHAPAPNTSAFTQEEVAALKDLVPMVAQLKSLIGQLRTKVSVPPPSTSTPPAISKPKPAIQGPRVNPGLKKSVKPQPEEKKEKKVKNKKPVVPGAVFPPGHRVMSEEETAVVSANTSAKIAAMKNGSNALSQGIQNFQKYGGNPMPAQLIEEKNTDGDDE